MIDITTFDISTRRMLQTMRMSDIFGIDLQCGDGVSWVFGHWNVETHYVGWVVGGETEPFIGTIGDGGLLDPGPLLTP